MPHLIVEYTRNLGLEGRIQSLLERLSNVLIAQGGQFPVGGIRARAICLTEYRMADGSADDAFVHVTLAVAPGRTRATLEKAINELFDTLAAFFSPEYRRRYLALSIELREFDSTWAYKTLNNVHQRYGRSGPGSSLRLPSLL
ncbi:5-carboxymethyl-2-hydroxymuconate isomerase [Cupriavidus necator]|uniref:5-carboxymethyl-2-hydroxymuconate isomerase n=1 Tax=Cupriavidus necator TaxID=106590 RepID=A0A1U9UZN4_CUPNE|nr:5-carboxymethyl-2-hydroxymuconate Delta-isomerase [Cupriavidus necator]AQV98150.1 5-carboxymethyl-2-hydroxymuconate isomerase [Cupriavidus necator]